MMPMAGPGRPEAALVRSGRGPGPGSSGKMGSGDRVVLRRDRSRGDARYRLRMMRALHAPAAGAGLS